MATIRSTSLAMKLEMICCITLPSRLQLSSRISKERFRSVSASVSRWRMLAMIWLRDASSTKLQMPILKEVFCSARERAETDRSIMTVRVRAMIFFMVDTFLSVFRHLSGTMRIRCGPPIPPGRYESGG